MRPGVSAVRVNGLSSVLRRSLETMQEVEVETGEGMLVGPAGAELISLARVMRETRTALVCIFNE